MVFNQCWSRSPTLILLYFSVLWFQIFMALLHILHVFKWKVIAICFHFQKISAGPGRNLRPSLILRPNLFTSLEPPIKAPSPQLMSSIHISWIFSFALVWFNTYFLTLRSGFGSVQEGLLPHFAFGVTHENLWVETCTKLPDLLSIIWYFPLRSLLYDCFKFQNCKIIFKQFTWFCRKWSCSFQENFQATLGKSSPQCNLKSSLSKDYDDMMEWTNVIYWKWI